MRELKQYERLGGDDPLRSRSGRYGVSYDSEGVAVLIDESTGAVRWRAGDGERVAVGRLLLGDGGAIQVEDSANEIVWISDMAAPGARSLRVKDEGDFELYDEHGMPLFNSRTGPIEAVAMKDAAPAADITAGHYLVRKGKWRRLVTREPDGSLLVSAEAPDGSGWTRPLVGPLVSWLEQDGTVLTWRLLNKRWSLCLVDADGELLWQEVCHDVPMVLPPPAKEHAYGGPELGLGGRLRHQSLTSPSGGYTLVHQEDGNLVCYDNQAHQAIWASDTWWAGDGWAELTEDGELVIRTLYGAPVWRSGTAGRGVRRLVVGDFGGAALLDAGGSQVWGFRTGQDAATEGTTDTTARGSVMRRGQTLRRQSLTSADGGTVLAHGDDGRVVLYGEDGRWVWNGCTWSAAESYLALDEDGVLRVRAADGTVAEELGGPGEKLIVLPAEVRLCRDDGTVIWRNGQRVAVAEPDASPPEDFTTWLKTLMDFDDERAYGVSVVHDVAPAEALRRLGVEPTQIMARTWKELQEYALSQEPALDEGIIAAFALGPHTLVVEDTKGGEAGVTRPELSEGTFAVSCSLVYIDKAFVVHRDGETVTDHNTFDGSEEPNASEVLRALAAMGSDDLIDTVSDHDIELLCRVAGVRPTEADVAGVALGAFVQR